MMFVAELIAQYAQARMEHDLEIASLLRHGREPAPSFRQALGHRIVRLGLKLAAEPSRESVRSR